MIEYNKDFVGWDDRYSIGIPVIDEQHKTLIEITNRLFVECLNEEAEAKFRGIVREVVDYVKYHFSSEEKILERIGYPGIEGHKREHEFFVKELLAKVQAFEEGQKYVPNLFARFLKDWILTHVAISDKAYATYLFSLKEEGKLLSRLREAWNIRELPVKLGTRSSETNVSETRGSGKKASLPVFNFQFPNRSISRGFEGPSGAA
jgi:hemerythrin